MNKVQYEQTCLIKENTFHIQGWRQIQLLHLKILLHTDQCSVGNWWASSRISN